MLTIYTGIQSSEHKKHFQLLLLESRPLTSDSVKITGDRIHMNRLFVIKITGDHKGSNSSVEKCKQTRWNLFFGVRLLLQNTEGRGK